MKKILFIKYGISEVESLITLLITLLRHLKFTCKFYGKKDKNVLTKYKFSQVFSCISHSSFHGKSKNL